MSIRTRTEYSILNIITGLGGYAINTVIGFICRIVFIRCLSAEYLGINGLFTNILTMLSLAELGISNAIVFALYKPLATNDEQKIASLMRFYSRAYKIIGVVVVIFGLCMIPFLKIVITDTPNIKENIYSIYILYLLSTSGSYFFSYKSSLIMADQKNYIVTGTNYILTIIQSIIQIIYLFCTKEYMGYLIIQTVSNFVYYFMISYIANKKYPYLKNKDVKPLSNEEKRRLVSNVKSLTIWKLSALLVNNTDNIIITYFSGLSTVGISSNYTLLSSTLASLLNQIFNGITASVGNYNVLETKERKIDLFNFINLFNFWLFGWATLGIVVMSNDIVELCFGNNYILPFEIPCIIGLNFYMVGMQNAVWTYKNTMGLFRQGRYLLIITAILNLLFSIVLGNKWGLFGILAATAISRLFTNTWYDPYAVFKYGLCEKPIIYFKKYIQYFFILIIAIVTSLFICSYIKLPLFTRLVLKFIICCIVPNIIFIISFRNRSELLYFNNLLRNFIYKLFKSRQLKNI